MTSVPPVTPVRSAASSTPPEPTLQPEANKHFPHFTLMVRARHRSDAYELMDLGAHGVYREHLDTSIRLGEDVLRALGHGAYSARRAGQQFRQNDEDALMTLAAERHDMATCVRSVRAQIAQQAALLTADRELDPTAGDHAWDSEQLRTLRS